MEQEKIIASLNLLKHLPPSKNHSNAIAISNLIPDLADDLLSKIDKPLDLGVDPDNGNQYIQSEFNRDGDSYRSFWSNKYSPPIENAIYPSQHLRELETKANQIFKEYAKLYYGGGIQSTYFWDKDNGGFACAFLMKKEVDKVKEINKGIWDSINVIDVKVDEQKKKAIYKITTSIILDMCIKNEELGEVTISGSLIKAREEQYSYEKEKFVDDFHLEKIGKLVEEMETQMRQYLDSIYVSKTKETIDTIRSIDGNAGFEQLQRQKAGQIYIIQNKQQ